MADHNIWWLIHSLNDSTNFFTNASFLVTSLVLLSLFGNILCANLTLFLGAEDDKNIQAETAILPYCSLAAITSYMGIFGAATGFDVKFLHIFIVIVGVFQLGILIFILCSLINLAQNVSLLFTGWISIFYFVVGISLAPQKANTYTDVFLFDFGLIGNVGVCILPLSIILYTKLFPNIRLSPESTRESLKMRFKFEFNLDHNSLYFYSIFAISLCTIIFGVYTLSTKSRDDLDMAMRVWEPLSLINLNFIPLSIFLLNLVYKKQKNYTVLSATE